MSKINSFIDNQKIDFKKLFKNYMVTLISVAFLSIIISIYNGFEYGERPMALKYVGEVVILFSIGSMFLETLLGKEEEKRNTKTFVIGYIINVIAALIWEIVLVKIDEHPGDSIIKMNVYKVFVVYIILLSFITFYKIVKKSGLPLDSYIARVTFGLLKVWAVLFVLILSIELLFIIFDNLIMEINHWEIFEYIYTILGGFLVFPYTLMTITNTTEDNSRFTKGFIKYLCLPSVYIAILIIYMYIIKIFITGEIPSNEVFEICAYLFLFGAPVWFMAYGFLRQRDEEEETTRRYTSFVKNIKYAYIPMIILEIVCLSIRISQYGLTESRYLGVVLIIIQILYVVWDILGYIRGRKIGYEEFVLVIMVILIIINICPVININKLCFNSQKNRFEAAMENENYDEARGAYDYLKYSEYGEEYLNSEYTESEHRELKMLLMKNASQTEVNSYYEYASFYVSQEGRKKGVNIEGYTKIFTFSHAETDVSWEEMQNITINYGEDMHIDNVDLTDTIEYFIEKDKSDSHGNMEYYYLEISPDCCLIIDNITFKYMDSGEKLENINFSGYVLINNGGKNGQ